MKRIFPIAPWIVSGGLFVVLLGLPGSEPTAGELSNWAYVAHVFVFLGFGWAGSRWLTERTRRDDLATELIRSQKVMDDYLKASGSMLIMVSTDGSVVRANANAGKFFGMSSEQMVGRNWMTDFVPESMRPIVREEFDHLLAGSHEAARLIEIPVTGEDAKLRPVIWHHSVWRDADGSILGIVGWGKDASERRRMKAQIQTSERRLNAILENSPTLIYLKDKAGRYTLANSAYCALHGRSRDQIIGRTEADIQPDFADEIQERDRKVRGYTKPVMTDETANFGGVDRHYRTYRFPLLDSTNNAYGTGVIAFDVTGQKAVEEALRVSEEQYRHLVENPGINHVVFVRDHNGRLTYMSPSVHQILGYYPNDFITNSHSIRPGAIMNPSGRHHAEMSSKGTRQPPYEIETTHKNGSTVILEVIEVPLFNSDGSVRAVQGIAHDVTERKRSAKVLQDTKHQLDSALESFSDGIALFDSNRALVLSNSAFQSIQPHLTEILQPGTSLEAIVEDMISGDLPVGADPEDVGVRQPLVDDLVTDGELEYSQNNRWYHLKLYPAREGGVALVREDITERRNLERELVLSQKLKAVGQLTGGVAHDFNNILAVILGNLQLLEEDLPAETEASELVEAAIRAVGRGGRLTEQLLAFSRRQSLRPQVVDPNALLSGMIRMLQRTLGEDISIETRLMPDVGWVKIDPTAFENAILNLAINARAAMPQGGRLIVESRSVSFIHSLPGPDGDLPAGRYVALAITDTGCGMSESVASRAFEPFFTTKEVGSGSGLGLSMVYGFAKQSAGHAAITSEIGQGSSITLFLPVAEESAIEKAKVVSSGDDLHNGSGTVLVVEDDAQLRAVTVQNIQSMGYEVMEAEDGQTALNILAENQDVDLVFSDIVMPGGINGGQLAEKIAELYEGTPVVLTTGYPDRGGVVSEGLAEDIIILQKPYNKRVLFSMLQSVLGGKSDAP